MTLADLQAKIAKHAWEDPAFEAEFMANPKATFEKHTGSALPPELTIRAHYNSPTELHFVLPKRETASGELSDEDLERVAGGELVVLVSICVVSLVSIATTVAADAGAHAGW